MSKNDHLQAKFIPRSFSSGCNSLTVVIDPRRKETKPLWTHKQTNISCAYRVKLLSCHNTPPRKHIVDRAESRGAFALKNIQLSTKGGPNPYFYKVPLIINCAAKINS